MVISRVEGGEKRESKESKEKGKKTKMNKQTHTHTYTKKNRANDINREK
jgi:hypothetical protein